MSANERLLLNSYMSNVFPCIQRTDYNKVFVRGIQFISFNTSTKLRRKLWNDQCNIHVCPYPISLNAICIYSWVSDSLNHHFHLFHTVIDPSHILLYFPPSFDPFNFAFVIHLLKCFYTSVKDYWTRTMSLTSKHRNTLVHTVTVEISFSRAIDEHE